MIDPVIIPDGSRYERKALLQWLYEGNKVSPITKQPFTEADIKTDDDLRERISLWNNVKPSRRVKKHV